MNSQINHYQNQFKMRQRKNYSMMFKRCADIIIGNTQATNEEINQLIEMFKQNENYEVCEKLKRKLK